MVDLYTEYQSRAQSDSTETGEDTRREQARAKARALAQRLTTQTGVKIRFFQAERLHDRFLLIDERVWHVGQSFNKLGEEFSAIVEMHDRRRIAQIKSFMDRAQPDGETA